MTVESMSICAGWIKSNIVHTAKRYEARQEIRPNHERNATRRIQNAYGDKYDMLRMYDSKRSVANLLNEAAEERSVREKLRTIQKEQKSQQQKKPKYKDWER